MALDLAALNVLMGLPPATPPGGAAAPGTGPRGPSLDGGPAAGAPPTPTAPGASPQPGGTGASPMDVMFPTAGAENVLAPGELNAVKGNALFHAGLSLLAAGGPRPQGTRNFGADLMAAFDPTYMNTQIDRAVQNKQQGFQLMTRQKMLDFAKSSQQADPNESPVARANRIAAFAAEMAGINPQAAEQLSNTAKNLLSSIPETDRVDGIGPDGTYGSWLQVKQTGELLPGSFVTRGGVLSPDQQATARGQVQTAYEREVSPYRLARNSYDLFNTAYARVQGQVPSKTDAENLIVYANDVLHPGMHVSEEQVMDHPLPGELGVLQHLLSIGNFTSQDLTQLHNLVEEAAPARARESQFLQNHWRGIWQQRGAGEDPGSSIDNPWDGFGAARGVTGTPGPKRDAQGNPVGPDAWAGVLPWDKRR